MEINLNNIEDLIFYDKKTHILFPEFRHLFDQWALSKRIGGMENLGNTSVLDVLNALDNNHLLKLEEHFKDFVIINKTNHKIVANAEIDCEDISQLCQYVGYRDFCIHKSKDRLYLSFWR